MTHWVLEVLPIPAVYLTIVALILGACELGLMIGRRYHQRHKDEGAPASLAPVVSGLLGMLAFLLAFTFSMAFSQHGNRSQTVRQEASAISVAYQRADLLSEAASADAKRLLREYVDIRIRAAETQIWQPADVRSREIHRELWAIVAAAAKADPGANGALAAASINDVVTMHEARVIFGVHARISIPVWIGLLLIASLAMGTLGLQIGLNGKRRMLAVTPMALTFAVLVTLIVDLNRPQDGFIRVGQLALLDLQKEMQRDVR
jgi:hypothetical protein